ncbi:MAG: ParB N-terminal domain-containing protein [Gemmataceae bacterium]|nr:ParB N-terminal domain-containing protein [Gemmataceae bacterium]
MELRTLPVADLVPAPYNPRQPLAPEVRSRLERSLREFGLVEPLIWNASTGHIVGGHARLEILKSLGVESVPVSVVYLSAERERALNVVLNNREAQGRFDTEKLAELLTELEELPELELTGFSPEDLRGLRLEPVDQPTDEPGADVIEVRLTILRADYDRVAPALDGLVRDFSLECRVRGL